MRYLINTIAIFMIIACDNPDENYHWVAKYDDYVLTQLELEDIMPKDLSGDDSIQFVNDYVEKWVKDKVLMHSKDSFLTEEELSRIEQQVAQYKEDLTEITIEDKLTLGFSNEVSEEELKKYYEDYPDTFVLSENIVSYRLMRIPDDSTSQYKRLLRGKHIDSLQTKLETYGFYHDFTPNNWIPVEKFKSSDILPDPIKEQPILSGNQIYTTTENGESFVLEVVDVGLTGTRAPYTYIKPTIKSVVLNKRKLNLLSQKKNELYEKALENDEIKRK